MSEVAINKKNKSIKRENIFTIFRDGDIFTKLSFLIMGFANFTRKQIVKGLIYLACEISFIFFMITTGVERIKGLMTLGTKTQGWVMDEALGIEVLSQGDNSMLFLLYGVCTMMVVAVFIAVYISNIYSARKLQVLEENNEHIPTLREDIHDLLDNKFHVTLMIIPMIMVGVFTVLPLIYMILIAFTNYDKDHQPPGALFHWVGLDNFGDMLFSASTFSQTFFPVLGWTLVWAVVATATCYFGGIILALLINKDGIKFKKGWRTIFVTTMAIPQFISLLIMRIMLNDYGPINALLQNLGITDGIIQFLVNPHWARIVVIVVNFWIGVPFTMLSTTGILQNIPGELYEAAKIDGANALTIFWKITLPYMIFVMTPNLITSFTGNINNFNVIYLLSGGGPTNAKYYFAGDTDLLVTWLYKLTIDRADYNLGAVIGILTFVVLATVSLITYRNTASYKDEGAFQ